MMLMLITMYIPGIADNGDTASIADTNELTSTSSLDASSTPHIPSLRTSPIITVLPTLILLITLGMIVTALVCLRKHTRKGKHEASNIQCQENSAYQEVEHGNRVDHIQCLENSAYLEIKHEHEFQCRENCAYQECCTKQQHIKVDNTQSSNSDYEECNI